MAGAPAISVTVIARNEERNLSRCLRSVSWADEIIVVDSGSTDRTIAIARDHGAIVHVQPWGGFAAQKNFAVDRARHDWILSLDADEWFGPEAEAEIREAARSASADAYSVPRVSALSGAFVRRAWRGDRPVRLFRRDRARFGGGHVHESLRLAPDARLGKLASPLYHLSYRSIEDYVDRMNRYTSLAARSLHEDGKRPRPARLVISPLAAFARHYVLKAGWRDGVRGLVVAAGSAFYAFFKYAKAWDLERAPDPEFRRLVPPTPDDPVPDSRSPASAPDQGAS